VKNCIKFSILDHVLPTLEQAQNDLSICEKALMEFMEEKRKTFPRFFFVSPADLLDILSNGNNPSKVMVHMPKIISAVDTLELKEQSKSERPYTLGMHAGVGKEYVKFTGEGMLLMGKVENYLQDVINVMRSSLKDIATQSLSKFKTTPKEEWLKQDPAQVTLLINVCSWVINVEQAFRELDGNKNALQKAYDDQDEALKALIVMVQGDLDKPLRQKIMCLITMDAHSRDIIQKLQLEGVVKQDEFQWQTQLKGVFDSSKGDFVFRIADACLAYGYEYLGNGPRLVITPLTDRIYVTATQALHLKMGCAPAGPAGTGKTESTKDLAAALGKACYVFNCSDQMDYMSMAGIFKGLAASGSWGCFDEFNRLVPEVLSVCSVQFKSVTDAVRAGNKRFVIQEVEIALDPTCGAFITMNPGYLGRSELPEGLKALFRPITVVVPDLKLICENMLMAEGFVDASLLAKKFVTLYFLCRDLLSKAAHYDWGLRAIKSVLVVAGVFKRAEPGLEERAILMRALRDFNTPKIVAADFDIFMGLLNDLFPKVNVERKRDMRFESIIKEAAVESKLHPDDEFIKKTVQLGELLAIRHCVFVMGPPACGKSETWKTLAKANDKDNQKTTWIDINPKVTSTNELYGVVLLATREWKDGLLSKTMRDLGNIPNQLPKWIILDGDLDANWIESMNSVMDDNRLLTLASNERIPLKPHMRLIFEIRDLRFATPATVSRAGILYISDDAGNQWKSYVTSWLDNQKFSSQNKTDLKQSFDLYMAKILFDCKKKFNHILPQKEMAIVVSICKLLQNIFTKNEVSGVTKVFVFAVVWCVGGGYTEKDGIDYKKNFTTYLKDLWKTLGLMKGKMSYFDFYCDFANGGNLEEWSKMTTGEINIDTSKPIPYYTIPTVDTISASYLMKQFIQVNHCPLLVGMAGCGKTQIIKGLLNEMCTVGDTYIQQSINMNFYTDADLLQLNLEQQLEKKAGKTYGPIGKFKLIMFIDDMNMPMRDAYDTQTSIALLRQHRDYTHWYDKNKLTLKEVINTQMVAAMNPTAGSFFVNPRLQRHFWLLAVGLPENGSLTKIYQSYLEKHFSSPGFTSSMQAEIPTLIKVTLLLHNDVMRLFKKTAANFHYEFNVRHLTNVFQGMLTANA
jgi:dynein heavy chain